MKQQVIGRPKMKTIHSYRWDFNTSLSMIDRRRRQKISKDVEDLKNTQRWQRQDPAPEPLLLIYTMLVHKWWPSGYFSVTGWTGSVDPFRIDTWIHWALSTSLSWFSMILLSFLGRRLEGHAIYVGAWRPGNISYLIPPSTGKNSCNGHSSWCSPRLGQSLDELFS